MSTQEERPGRRIPEPVVVIAFSTLAVIIGLLVGVVLLYATDWLLPLLPGSR